MVSIIKQIKSDQLFARKHKLGSVSLLTTLIGESERVGKDNGNREPTDKEVISVVKKFIKGLRECIANTNDEDKIVGFLFELQLLEYYIPGQLTDEELSDIISEYVTTNNLSGGKAIGPVMKYLNSQYSGLFDGKSASKIAFNYLKHLS